MTEMLLTIMENAQQTKLQMIHDPRKQDDLSPYVIAYRGDQPICMVMVGGGDPSALMDAASISATGFDADGLMLAFETWQARPGKNGGPPLNPLTGEQWSSGEMQDVVDNHDGLAKGWVLETVGCAAANRAGDVHWINMPFSNLPGEPFRWIEEEFTSSIGEISQWEPVVAFAQELHRIMDNVSASQLEGSQDATREQKDTWTMELLLRHGNLPMAFTYEGSPWHQELMESDLAMVRLDPKG